jgi:hypothetical protein
MMIDHINAPKMRWTHDHLIDIQETFNNIQYKFLNIELEMELSAKVLAYQAPGPGFDPQNHTHTKKQNTVN